MARVLILEYIDWLALDLSFQDVETELADLPALYAPPGGAMLIARGDTGEALGCVALKDRGGGTCEMKRLWVRPTARGLGLGARLTQALLEAGRGLGYRRMVLDTLPRLEAAVASYRRLGFTDIAPYYDNPVPGVLYMGRDL
ncbi:acetyltransferase (GNAT) family protein [Pseudoroseicyclus aestuarii]|uniref:Acetyltransferase (GNAT) family protein n=1 Tax=Pseudoroseicyclus aestuarii TaxID=1795041 RepID=A0A318SN48_9RHOB|nr:acetyltransferase (GNAT) family protein [Pseudoroseicyclus aestuarii]